MANAFLAAARVMDRAPRLAAFSGAQMTRLTSDWSPFNQSPDWDIRSHIGTLRARARQLVKDNSHAAGFVNELANNVVGPDGILLQAKITNAQGKPAKKTNDEIERGWKEWGMPENASADGADDWTSLQRLFIRTIATDGEVFIRKLRYFDNPFGFSLQIIDADLVDEHYNVPALPNGNRVRMGVEVNRWNRPVAYYVWSAYPGEGDRELVRIPAEDMIHRFVRYRPNQVRGVTWFAPVLINLHYLDGYEFSELQASRVAAAKMGFILNKHPDAIAAFKPPKPGEKPRVLDVEPGLIPELLPGQEFASFDPTHPSSAFKDFTKAVLRAIARGLNMAYTTLTGDLEAVNYSSIRAGLLSERDHFRGLQRWMGIHILRPIYREWLGMALLAGAVRVDSRLAANYYAVEWKPRGWKWVDPVNDLTAAALAIALGLDSRTRLAAEQGRDFEEIVDEIQAELEYAESVGVDVSGETTQKALPAGDTADYESPATEDGTAEEADAVPADQITRAQRRRQIHALRTALRLMEAAA